MLLQQNQKLISLNIYWYCGTNIKYPAYCSLEPYRQTRLSIKKTATKSNHPLGNYDIIDKHTDTYKTSNLKNVDFKQISYKHIWGVDIF